jgi:hypothetical protein
MKSPVIIEKIFNEKANGEAYKDGYKGLQLRQTENVKNLTTVMLGGEGFDKSTVAFHTISEEVLGNAKEGDDLGSILGMDIRIAVSELTQSQFDALSEDDQRAYQEKKVPADEEKGTPEVMLTCNGEQIWRKSFLAEASKADVRIQHDDFATEEVPVAEAKAEEPAA